MQNRRIVSRLVVFALVALLFCTGLGGQGAADRTAPEPTAGSVGLVGSPRSTTAPVESPPAELRLAPDGETCPPPDLGDERAAFESKAAALQKRQKSAADRIATLEAEAAKLIDQGTKLEAEAQQANAEADKLRGTIAAHNAQQIDRTNAAAVAAYNQRAAELNSQVAALKKKAAGLQKKYQNLQAKADKLQAERDKLLADLDKQHADLEADRAALQKKGKAANAKYRDCLLAEANNGAPAKYSEAVVQKVAAAKNKIPASWKVPAKSRPDRAPRLADDDAARELYQVLRKQSPHRGYPDVKLQGKERPKVGDVDPALPGGVIIKNAKGGPAVSPDHILPLVEVMGLPGFRQLGPKNMLVVANASPNLQWVSSKANRIKQDYNTQSCAFDCFEPKWVAYQQQLEKQARQDLTALIKALLSTQ